MNRDSISDPPVDGDRIVLFQGDFSSCDVAETIRRIPYREELTLSA